MKRGKQIDAWYPFFIDKWLFGSTRHELIINRDWPEKYPDLVKLIPPSILEAPFTDLRGIFSDLMAISKKDGGFVRANETTPYPLEQLAGLWCVPLDYLRATLAICLSSQIGKLTEPAPGIFYVTSTETYALSDRWKRAVKGECSEKAEACSEKAEACSGKGEPILKENRGEESIKKEYPDAFPEEDVRLTELLIELMARNNPESSIIRRLTMDGRGRWADVVRKLRELDGRSPAAIEAVIRFSQDDGFWAANILSMPTLRDKWDRLVMNAKRPTNGAKASQVGAGRQQTEAEREHSMKLREFYRGRWDKAAGELAAAREKGKDEYERVQAAVEARIRKEAAEFQASLNPVGRRTS